MSTRASTAATRQRDQQAAALVQCLDTLSERLQPERPSPQDPPAPPREIRAINAIWQQESITMTALAGLLELPLSTATHLVDRLVERGTVERRRTEKDRRIVEVTLTAAGRDRFEAQHRQRLTLGRELLASLTLAERQTFLDLAGKLADPAPPRRTRAAAR